jgi:hypothetical protein
VSRYGRTTAVPTMEDAVARLSALLMEENAALDAMDFARAGSLLAAKHAAADALAAAWRAADPGAVVSEKMHELGLLADSNRQLLKRAASRAGPGGKGRAAADTDRALWSRRAARRKSGGRADTQDTRLSQQHT